MAERWVIPIVLLLSLIMRWPLPLCTASSHAGYDSAISMIESSSREDGDGEGLSSGITHRHSSPNLSLHHSGSRCIDIPANFTLCRSIQYRRMHLPNLLDHETIDEALEQSNAWLSLIRLHCHPETRLFLCSLFAPVCLDESPSSQLAGSSGASLAAMKIQPCRSLCAAVKSGCEERMQQYGFPWPEILRCEKFPSDNDMCIRLSTAYEEGAQQTTTTTSNSPHSHRTGADSGGSGRRRGTTCKSCAQVSTFENLMDSYCRSTTEKRKKIHHSHGSGGDASGSSEALLLVPWQAKDKGFKSAVRRFRKLNCKTLGREIRESMLATGRQHPFRRTIFR